MSALLVFLGALVLMGVFAQAQDKREPGKVAMFLAILAMTPMLLILASPFILGLVWVFLLVFTHWPHS